MKRRKYNFSAGPAVLPEEVVAEAQENLLSYQETGIGIMEMSHRSADYQKIVDDARDDLRNILNINDSWEVLFLHGGASLQFHMLPLNMAGKKVSYINTGVWSKKAIAEAKRLDLDVNIVATSEDRNFSYIPAYSEEDVDCGSSYLHFTSNNTIFGTAFQQEPLSAGLPLTCDASSDFLSKPLDMDRYGLIYGGAQKNMGPAGLAVVVVNKAFLEKTSDNLPPMLSYKNHAASGSMFNTPPAFAIYVTGLVFKWIKKNGGLTAMKLKNEQKAQKLYDYIDSSDFYNGTAEKDSRSLMNVTFRLPSEEKEKLFIARALEKDLSGLKGHRSVGGIRASIYNAFPAAGVDALLDFMDDFSKQ